jgi:iron(II)-dependent oxidoreductase
MAQTPRTPSGLERGHAASIDSPDMHRAGRDMLSLALIDARNHTLHLLSLFEQALGADMQVTPMPEVVPPVWLAGHVGWFAEWWIGRNTQRAFGNDMPHAPDPAGLHRPRRGRLVEPLADGRWRSATRIGLPDLPDLACKPSRTCSRRWRARWNCSSTRPRPMPACTSTGWRSFTKTCAASSSS